MLDLVTGRLGQIQDLQESFECLLYCLELDWGSVSSRELDLSNIMWEEEVLLFSSRQPDRHLLTPGHSVFRL